MMTGSAYHDDNLLDILKEREKELNCLYEVYEVLSDDGLPEPEMFGRIVGIIPSGLRFPELSRVRIVVEGSSYQTPGFRGYPISEVCSIRADSKTMGSIEIAYVQEVPITKEGYFLEKERQLIRTIADRIGQRVVFRKMRSVVDEWEMYRRQGPDPMGYREWEIIVDFLRHTDPDVLLHISRKMINYLFLSGFASNAGHVQSPAPAYLPEEGYVNFPTTREPLEDVSSVCERAFGLAKKHLSDDEITARVKRWMREEKAYSLIKAVSSVSPSLRDIIEEIKKYKKTVDGDSPTHSPQERLITVSLINRILSDRPEYVNVAKQYLTSRDFFDFVNSIIYPVDSQGKLGGKGSGLFLAGKILERCGGDRRTPCPVKVPRTWYIVTDAFTEFLQYNNLEELNEQKYKELQEARIEYPNILQLIKNSKLPPEVLKSLSVALDDFGEVPIIVRSSSLLEDQIGAAFSGKYKSLFLANRGSKQERLDALEDAVLEVYASVFSPDPIQYRSERGLIDLREEMGILIQEVVGTKAGKYFSPLFSGVAFGYNDYRWSPGIKREDGLIRLVPGLGTRAVDRLSDDFPVLISPGNPGIRVNVAPDEIKRYSPKKIDVIDLESGKLETVDISEILKECGREIPKSDKIVSIYEENYVRRANRFEIDFEKSDLVVTFDGIIAETRFVEHIRVILKTLREKMGFPVDVEFAYDGNDLYLLQCRPQSFSRDRAPAPIPRDIAPNDVIFSARRHISNGTVENISHIVYIDPDKYGDMEDLDDLVAVGKVVGLLNGMLPRRRFVLVGPGRWGSRGDIKLGVKVGYADICNTAALIEVARKKNGYMPELSFGTHFFQDLVEANIHYLPLYPDDDGIVFNSTFLMRSGNILKDICPEYGYLEDTVRVIDVPESSYGKVLRILMNADLNEAVGILSERTATIQREPRNISPDRRESDDSAWRWRFHMAEVLASKLDAEIFGVKGMYLFGSTNNGTAGPGSDIDLIVHFRGSDLQREQLLKWLEGWSLSLAEMNYLKTGYRTGGLLDVHIVTDEDISRKTPFAAKIDSVTDPVHRLKLNSRPEISFP
jgi:pyruvate,water dikinase